MTDASAAATPAFTAADVELIDRKTKYHGYFRIERYRLRHRRFDGSWSDVINREVFERGHSVGVLLYDPARDAVVLIEQFRVGALAAGREPWMLEIVAGMIEPGHTLEETAMREAVEESGCTVRRLERIADYLASPGGTSENTTLFVGEIDSRAAGGVHGLAEENEDIKVHVMSATVAINLADSDRIHNSPAMVALFWLSRHREDLRDRWLRPVPAADAMP
ncbi:MAG: ADP-ribose diphosphatase [Azospirillaceae bacterium]|nr:ADP-ribose diphosphatase [Azospirillaceae bacterium]